MAVVILERREPSVPTATFSCDGCKSKLRAEEGDGKVVSDPRDGDYVVICCPVCSAANSIASKLFK